MIYSATYETTTEIINLAVEMLNSDEYYAVNNGGWGGSFGTNLLQYDRQNENFYVWVKGVGVIPLEEIDASTIMNIGKVAWTACSGNYTGLTFHEDGTFLLEIDSRRHGIPFKGQLLEALEGALLLSIEEYNSSSDHWRWWETLEDHQGEGPVASFEEEDGWDAEPKTVSHRKMSVVRR